jgi:hypothetical protein
MIIYLAESMSVLSSLMFLVLSLVCVFSMSQKRSQNDNMCKVTGGILCVKDQLMIIATIAKGIAHASIEIETNVNII